MSTSPVRTRRTAWLNERLRELDADEFDRATEVLERLVTAREPLEEVDR